MRRRLRSLGAFAALALTLGGEAAPVSAQAPASPGYVLPETQSWEMAGADGQVYRIHVSMPKGPPPKEGFPVLYVLDGNAMFAGFAEARRIQGGTSADATGPGNSMIVGIGHPSDQVYDTRRLYDFTPPYPEKIPPSMAALAKVRAGGREHFADFMLNRLRPELARRYSINPDRQALFGHSLGGLFALHMLYTHPAAFNAIIAASPSQWWNDQSVLAEERAFAERLARSQIKPPLSRILVVAGALEERAANSWDAEALARRLEPLSAYGLRSRFEMFEGETHITVPHRAITTSLRFAFERP